ncbi:ferrous iron transport protein B [Bifidobacterium sp. ESL0790]|uniref:ferrous iron transport protein B n=1 Tax=Bifidobacterium sp. ESL0790 TaxID=2983233 RepID=UPI0023F78110|nr:ferrous iron transport protein B [Bifidobacterium sp. ESL0790]WEV72440.1 ferrous iron transport protein B [Bifidobacterium sp. ESL0790]
MVHDHDTSNTAQVISSPQNHGTDSDSRVLDKEQNNLDTLSNPNNSNESSNPNDADNMPEPADCGHGGGGHGGHHHRRGLAVLLPQRHHGHDAGHGHTNSDAGDMAGMPGMDSGAGAEAHHANPRIVFVGNPNVGKSTLFNAILGANATVMNAPGTTVLVESGSLTRDGERWDFIDTPGTASLDAYSPDEQVAGEAAMGRSHYARPDVIIFAFNATSPSKSFYLLSQLMDLGMPIIVAVTMLDLAEKQDSPITLKRLERVLPGIPMVRVDGRTGEGKTTLLDAIDAMLTEIQAQTQTKMQTHTQTQSSAQAEFPTRPRENKQTPESNSSTADTKLAGTGTKTDDDADDKTNASASSLNGTAVSENTEDAKDTKTSEDAEPPTDKPSTGNVSKTAKQTALDATRKASEVVEAALTKAENAADATVTATATAANTATSTLERQSGPTLDDGGTDVAREIHVQLVPKPVTGIAAPPASASQDEVSQWVRATADERFEWIAAKLKEINKGLPQGATTTATRETFSDKLDRVLLHPAVGLIVFLITMFLVFEATTTLAGPLQDWFDVTLRGWCTDGIAWIFTAIAGKGSLDGWFYSLIVDGFLNGAITVCTFIPPMGIMFIILSLLEDSGYLARAAFVMDRAMRMIGLDGRAFLPLVVGFGCNLPALASTRTLPDSRQRLLTGLLIPFTSCSARLSVYVVLAYAFFGKFAGVAIFLMYVSSIVIILAVGFALRKTQFKDLKTQPFAMELPPYQMPRLLQLLKSVLQRLWSFITGASSVIVTMLIVVWVLSAIPISAGAAGTNSFGHVDEVENSVFGAASSAIAPVFKPAGFDDWHASAALVTGFVAKEVVVGSLSQSYAINDSGNQSEQAQGQGSLGQAVHKSFEKSSDGHPNAAAAAFMIFILAYTPCLATVAEMKRQYGMKFALQSVGTGLIVAYILAIIVFQVGRLL